MMFYNSSLKDKGHDAKFSSQMEIPHKVFFNDMSKTYMCEEFRSCDCIYSEIAWLYGYKGFNEKAGNIPNEYLTYVDNIARAIKELNVPAFIICGKNIKSHFAGAKIRPITITTSGQNIRGCSLYYWNYELPENEDFSETSKLIDFLAQKFVKCLDFSCGYGQHLLKFRDFIGCDINKDCLTFLALKASMPKKILYVIHTSPKRIDFVNEYMIPCLKRYGIEDIAVWNDEQMIGQLHAWTECAKWIVEHKKDCKGAWHLEDDVVPCKNFKQISEETSKQDIVVQGFITENHFFDFKGQTGILPIKFLPYGMQCVYIPNFYLKGFIDFMENEVKKGLYRRRQYDAGTLYSDNAFRGFMYKYHPDALVNNLDGCMVEHIDYLIGGRSIKNQSREDTKARKFDNYEEVERLKAWKEEKQNGKTPN